MMFIYTQFYNFYSYSSFEGSKGFKSGDRGGPLMVKGTKVQVGIITKGEDFDYGKSLFKFSLSCGINT